MTDRDEVTLEYRRLWLPRLAALALSLLIGILGIEVIVRLTGLDRPLLWEPDPELGWRHIPHAQLRWREEGDGRVRINSLGFRDLERTIQKPSGVFRIAVFGDSTTESIQVDLEQTFCQLLERTFRDRGQPVEVLNFGVSGYGPLQSYLLYEKRVRDFAPDLVLHAIFLDNDVADGDRRLAAGQRGAPFLKESATANLEIDYSAAIASVRSYEREPVHTLRNVSALYRMVGAARARGANATAVEAAAVIAGHIPRRFLLYGSPQPPEWEKAWRTFDRVVAKFSEVVKQDGGRYALLSVPAGQVVHAEVWQKLLHEYPAMASRTWDVLSAEKRLRHIAAEHDIPLIAPLDQFVQQASSGPLFFQHIGHLTPLGHRVMAAALEDALNEHQFIFAAAASSQ